MISHLVGEMYVNSLPRHWKQQVVKELIIRKKKSTTSNFVTVSFKEHESTHESKLEYQNIVIDAHRRRPLSKNSGNTCIIEQLRGTCVMPRLDGIFIQSSVVYETRSLHSYA